MNEILIKIEVPEIAKAINNLAQAIGYKSSGDEPAKDKTEKKPVEDNGPVKAESGDTDTEYTIEDVRAAFADYAKTKGKDAAKSILSAFGVTKVTSLKKSDYNSAIKMIQEG